MRPKTAALILLALLSATFALAACGEEEAELEAVEGEPLELAGLSYNVQITRFLNRNDLEDRTYLDGVEDPPPGEEYLGVFMRIANDSDEAQSVPMSMEISDTRENVFEAVETDNPFALELGTVIPPDGEVPAPDTAARSGPIKGSMVLFQIPETATENRPLELEIPTSDGEVGLIELDI